jgi:hypothetical protein
MNHEILSRQAINALLCGNTVYLRRPDGGVAPVFYDMTGVAHMQHHKHGRLSGPWQLTDDGYAVEWDKDVGRVQWTLRFSPGEIAYLDPKGEARGVIASIVAGDCEHLAA